jgi:hypothetical protein
MQNKLSYELEKHLPKQPSSYQIQKKTFVVETIFAKENKETLGNVLLRLIKADMTSA